MASQSVARSETVSGTKEGPGSNTAMKCVCPACGEPGREAVIERYGRFELFGCAACGLQFWEPREMPDARWYEQMYGGPGPKNFPPEPGGQNFFADVPSPRGRGV